MLKITVIIPVYNAEAFLRKAVESALQFDEVKEIILIEDKSTDNSLEICKKLTAEHSEIHLYQHPDKKNHGAGASRNLGLKKASHDFIAFLDADDYYLPNRFEAEKELFKNPETEGVFGAMGTEFLSAKGKLEFEKKFRNTQLTTVNYHAEGKDIFYGLLGLDRSFGSFFPLNCLTVRSESIRKDGVRFNENLRVHQDSDFIIKLAFHCHLKSGNITEPIAIRGVHDNNRITKITRYSQQYNQRQLLLWKSLYEWSLDKKIKKEYQEHLFLNKKAFELAHKKGLKKYISLLRTVIKNPNILKTRYRFTYTHHEA